MNKNGCVKTKLRNMIHVEEYAGVSYLSKTEDTFQ